MNIMNKFSIFAFLLAFCFASACNKPGQSSEITNSETASVHPAQSGNRAGSKKSSYKPAPGAKNTTMAASPLKEDAHSEEHLNTGGLMWTTFDKLAKENNSDNKKYLVDVYTEWCGWCKVMDKKTFTDPAIQKYLKKNFHIVKFDAERKNSVPFKGKQYEWVAGGRRGINQLALELLGSRLSYPTLVYLDENMNKITSSPGYKTPEQLIQELKAINDMKS
jgi:thioredoxin-related protein